MPAGYTARMSVFHQNSTTLALQDLTGGIVQSFSLQQHETFVIYQVLNSAVPRSSLIVASIHMVRTKDAKIYYHATGVPVFFSLTPVAGAK